MTDTPESAPINRVFLEFPPDWDQLSREDQLAVCRGMAVELQRQLGITPKPMGSEEQVEPGESLGPSVDEELSPG